MTNTQTQSSLPPTDLTSIRWLLWNCEERAWLRQPGDGLTSVRSQAASCDFDEAVQLCTTTICLAMVPVLPAPTTGEEKQR